MMDRLTLFNENGIPQPLRKDRGKMPKKQSRVYGMLLRGKCSAGDLCAALHVADPRGHIRDLREKGVAIMDEWCKGLDGVRFKRYWVSKEVTI